jgi:GNAT superfamily N-acetyltransferase
MITCRPTRLSELEAVDALVVESINELTQRHGFRAMASPSPPRFQAFSLQDDPRGLWTAEQDAEPVGFGWSWTSEDFWFLAQLFVKPGVQANGVGTELLRRTLQHADDAGAKQRALITFAFNTVSQGLYIRHGFAPRFVVYFMNTPRKALTQNVNAQRLEVSVLNASEAQLSAMAGVDRLALGFTRGKHHALLAREPGIRLFGFNMSGRLAGYAYVSQSGHIGPLAVASAELVAPAFDAALSLVAEGESENVSCFMPGSNPDMVRSATARGLRISFPMLMMSTERLGEWPCYLPRNPGFM